MGSPGFFFHSGMKKKSQDHDLAWMNSEGGGEQDQQFEVPAFYLVSLWNLAQGLPAWLSVPRAPLKSGPQLQGERFPVHTHSRPCSLQATWKGNKGKSELHSQLCIGPTSRVSLTKSCVLIVQHFLSREKLKEEENSKKGYVLRKAQRERKLSFLPTGQWGNFLLLFQCSPLLFYSFFSWFAFSAP